MHITQVKDIVSSIHKKLLKEQKSCFHEKSKPDQNKHYHVMISGKEAAYKHTLCWLEGKYGQYLHESEELLSENYSKDHENQSLTNLN